MIAAVNNESSKELPSTFGKGAGSEGTACKENREVNQLNPTALTLTLSHPAASGRREKGLASSSVTRNACKLCAPLGACLALRGVEGAVPFLHGSQGCSTYIRRYMIGHFKEPLDIASSNFSERTAIFGGLENLRAGLSNVIRQYAPQLIGVAGTCLAETIGDDVAFYLRQIAAEASEPLPELVHISSPSYAGTHVEGFHAAVHALVDTLAKPGPRHDAINVLPGMISPADLRYIQELLNDFGLRSILLPDYSSTLDGPIWSEYRRIPPGGTPIEAIRRMGSARATIEFCSTRDRSHTAGALLEERFGVPRHDLPIPMGVVQTDRLMDVLSELAGRPMPNVHAQERGRLIDSYVDAHKYVFGKRAVLYGEQDLVVGLASLLAEIGMVPAVCASGGKSGRLRERIFASAPDLRDDVAVLENADFSEIEANAAGQNCDLAIGSSKGYGMSRKLRIPLVRAGFPIHDRVDGPRLLHIGYRGAQQLFDRIVNAVIAEAQDASPVGYSYM
jgi:nitrogenase molybdenum-iron protein NifN